jgi:hypothetical protein
MGRRPTTYRVRLADDFHEKAAELETFDYPGVIFEYVEAVPGPRLITMSMAGFFIELHFLEKHGRKLSLNDFRARAGRCSVKRMIATLRHMELLDLIKCKNLDDAKLDTPLDIEIMIPLDPDELEERRLELWRRVKDSPAFRKRGPSRAAKRVKGVH